jgi:DnaJ-class molecular chaperone
MTRKTHYEVLEVSPKACSEVITAAYERLCAGHDPARQANPADARVRLRMAALQDAQATRNDP